MTARFSRRWGTPVRNVVESPINASSVKKARVETVLDMISDVTLGDIMMCIRKEQRFPCQLALAGHVLGSKIM
jgi:hypothetical protein